MDRIGRTGVLGLRAIVEVRHAGFIQHHVFQHGAEALRRGEDLRLSFLRQLDGLGVAAAFEVEDAGLAPAVLVVTDESALRISGERGLAGARQAEEDSRVTVLADVGRAMHRHDALRRQQVVEEGEDGLLHLAGIGRAADEHDHARQVAGNDRFGAAAVTGRIGLEVRQIDDGHLRHEGGQLFRLRADQQVADKQRVPGKLGIDTHGKTIGCLGAAVEILREQILTLGMIEEVAQQNVELLRRHLCVVVPPDLIFGRSITDNELVLRRTARVGAGVSHQSPAGRQPRLTALQRVFVKRRFVLVPINRTEPRQADCFKAAGRVPDTCLFHDRAVP